MKLILLLSFVAIAFAGPENKIHEEVVAILVKYSGNFKHFHLFERSINPNPNRVRDITFDIQDPHNAWDYDEPIVVKAIGRSIVEVNFPITMSYFYMNGTFKGKEPLSGYSTYAGILEGSILSNINGNVTLNVKAVYNVRAKSLVFDSHLNYRVPIKLVHHIQWLNCPASYKDECDRVEKNLLDNFMPQELGKEITVRVNSILYEHRNEIEAKIHASS